MMGQGAWVALGWGGEFWRREKTLVKNRRHMCVHMRACDFCVTSGADITEICQRACKSAIRENIEKDLER